MSTTNIYYPMLTPEELKVLIPEVNNNIENSYIEYNIELAQKQVMRPLLGYGLYNQILLELSGGTITDTGNTADNTIYNDYLKLILALSTYKRLVSSMHYHLENTGLRVKLTEVSDPTDLSQQSYYKNHIQNDIDFFKSELIEYICNNRTLYPLYFNDTDDRDDHTAKRNYTNSWTISVINGKNQQ